MPKTFRYIFIALLIFLSFYHLSGFPGVWYDDACHFITARNTAETGKECFTVDSQGECNPYSAFITVGPVLNYLTAGWMKITAPTMENARVIVVLFLMGTGWLTYRLAALLTAESKAFWALALLAGSIQFWTYGRQYLGEVPMIFFLLLGFYFQCRVFNEEKPGSPYRFIFAALCWSAAVLIKEYIAVPLAVLLVLLFICEAKKKSGRAKWIFFQAVVLVIPVMLYYGLRFPSIAQWLDYARLKSAYRTEFLDFCFWDSFRFMLKKPVIVFGLAALAIKVRFTNRGEDRLLFSWEIILIFFFLISRGYDRFGMILIPLPCIYLAEILGWYTARMSLQPLSYRVPHAVIFTILFVILFYQRTPAYLYHTVSPPPHDQVRLVSYLRENRLLEKTIFTPELDVVTFFPPGVHYRLPCFPPARYQVMDTGGRDSLPACPLPAGTEVLIWGDYGKTEYYRAYPEKEILRHFHVLAHMDNYSIYLRNGE